MKAITTWGTRDECASTALPGTHAVSMYRDKENVVINVRDDDTGQYAETKVSFKGIKWLYQQVAKDE